MLVVIAPILINKDVFEPSYNDLKFTVQNCNYFCTNPNRIHYSFPGGSDGKESACNAIDLGLMPGPGGYPGEENGNPLQYSCLENPEFLPWTEEPGGLQSTGSQTVGHD